MPQWFGLGSADLADPLLGSSSADADAKRQAANLENMGFAMFTLGFVVFAFFIDLATSEIKWVQNAAWLLYAFFQTGGLMIQAIADVEINTHFSRPDNWWIVRTHVVIWFICVGVNAFTPPHPASYCMLLQILPYTYLLWQWEGVLKMRPGFIRFSRLLAYNLAWFMFTSRGIYWIWFSLLPDQDVWQYYHDNVGSGHIDDDYTSLIDGTPGMLVGCFGIFGSLCVVLTYNYQKSCWGSQDRSDEQFYTASYAYLFFEGMVNLLLFLLKLPFAAAARP